MDDKRALFDSGVCRILQTPIHAGICLYLHFRLDLTRRLSHMSKGKLHIHFFMIHFLMQASGPLASDGSRV